MPFPWALLRDFGIVLAVFLFVAGLVYWIVQGNIRRGG